MTREESSPRISVLIPTFQGASDLERLLPALASQELPPELGTFELVAIDSSSTDGTVALLEAQGAHVRVIPQSEFAHGPTRNALANEARGEFFVYLSQDALPKNEHVLARLVEPLLRDAELAGVTARVLPHPTDDPLTARTAFALPEAGARPDGTPFNNVASAIRAAVWREVPFPDVAFGEDVAWRDAALAAGHRVGFAAEAAVYHAHRYTAAEAFERYRVDAAFRRSQDGTLVRPGLWSVLRGFLFEVREDFRYVISNEPSRILHLFRSPILRGAQVLGQYFGTRASDRDAKPEAARSHG